MARQGGGSGCVTMIAMVVIVGALVNAFSEGASPAERRSAWWFLGIVCGLAILFAILNRPRAPKPCGICGGPVGRKSYSVTINGDTRTACANCGSRLARMKSKKAVKDLMS